MDREPNKTAHTAWAHFRFSVVGPLLSAPPARGELKAAIAQLSQKSWRHPVTGEPARFSRATIERWYYQARAARHDPVTVLRRQVRKDAGRQSALSEHLVRLLVEQYGQYKHWSAKLHYDNLCALVTEDPTLGPMPSYATVRRFLRANGFDKHKRRRGRHGPGLAKAEAALEQREVRSYENQYVSGLWHLDFHSCSLEVLTPEGQWVHPKLLGVLDDHSRLACHVQWYWSQTAEDLVHGLCQAFCKRGLPRALLTDNGAAMIAEEVRQGLARLGVVHTTTLPYSPHQNGKQEVFWAVVEGRLMAMLEGGGALTLGALNQVTQAWVEMEYQRTTHSAIAAKPIDRFLNGQSVARPAPAGDVLARAFRQDVSRTQRRSDGTITLEGVRFEIPSRFRHLRQLTVRYARWNLRDVHLVDPRTDTLLTAIYPLNKAENADGRRRALDGPLSAARQRPSAGDAKEPPPLLKKLIADYAATGLPPAYLPMPPSRSTEVTP